MAISAALQDYIKGNRLTDEQVEERRAICKACPALSKRIGIKKQFPFFEYKPICKNCGCYLEGEVGKLKAPREKCPDEKW